MAQKTIIHKGYHGSIMVDPKDYSLFGTILFLDEKIHYSGDTFAELEAAFRQAVEDHIRLCQDQGVEPPFSE